MHDVNFSSYDNIKIISIDITPNVIEVITVDLCVSVFYPLISNQYIKTFIK